MPSASHIATWGLLPITLGAVYLYLLERRIARAATLSSGRRAHRPSAAAAASSSAAAETPPLPLSLPQDVASDPSTWVLAYERAVSNPVPARRVSRHQRQPKAPDAHSSAGRTEASPLLRAYARTVQSAFSWTPQAFAIRASIPEPAIRRSFDAAWIQNLAFDEDDLVNGVYKVTYRGPGHVPGSARIELVIEAPPSWTGPEVRGIIVAEVRGGAETEAEAEAARQVVFVNETWLWRREGEKATMLETAVGKWFHGLLAGWLVMRGIAGVTTEKA
ncbi:hypothetical protein D7B24_004243 [Verticillium nonalfalfae]|uniref:Uncharacterized protein n=1 Tax=Verticillium nonalfalfae TaxID=1051616 RepID=A0A3M9XVU5_9PEZI|nr:uncharacterized protein D7B24_004243 [Verticillium nonalfalfae]RNJ52151.1 hypothetical protein D7B24_004243 [Verticillium nonalfalfae]